MSIKIEVYVSTTIKSKWMKCPLISCNLKWCFGWHCFGQVYKKLAFDFYYAVQSALIHCYTPVKETVSRRRSRHISLGYILINVQAQVCEFFLIWGSKFLKFKKKLILKIKFRALYEWFLCLPGQNLKHDLILTTMLLLLLLSRFSRSQLYATPETAAHQAPPSLGFSRQEHWSGLPFPSPMQESEKWKWSRSNTVK